MTTGTVKVVVAERDFGFIASDDGPEIVFYRADVETSFEFDGAVDGERVAFEIHERLQGPRAVRVRPA